MCASTRSPTMLKTLSVPAGSVSEQMPGVSISFRAQPPHTRFDVVVSTLVDQELSAELTTALHGIGFTPGRPKHTDAHGVVSHSFEREGDGLCGGWTAS